jgi:hypothetical protein
MILIECDEDVSTCLKVTLDEDMLNPDLLLLPQAAPDADGGRLLATVE